MRFTLTRSRWEIAPGEKRKHVTCQISFLTRFLTENKTLGDQTIKKVEKSEKLEKKLNFDFNEKIAAGQTWKIGKWRFYFCFSSLVSIILTNQRAEFQNFELLTDQRPKIQIFSFGQSEARISKFWISDQSEPRIGPFRIMANQRPEFRRNGFLTNRRPRF